MKSELLSCRNHLFRIHSGGDASSTDITFFICFMCFSLPRLDSESIICSWSQSFQHSLERLSTCLNEQHFTLKTLHQDDVDTWGSNFGGLDQVEPWEDLCSAKQWVTSPLHSPKLEDHLLMPKETMPCHAIHSQILDKPKVDELPNSKKDEAKEPTVLIDITSSQTEAALTSCELVS